MTYNEFPNINQRMSDLTRRVRDQETAPRLYAAGIGAGGLTVNKGGSIHLRGGDINALTGGDVSVGSGGTINVLDSGQIVSEGAANFKGSAQLKGNTRIDGNLSIQGNVTFPDGKLDGSFLTDQFTTNSYSVANRSYSGSFTGNKDIITQSVSVPSWADYMYVMMSGVASLTGANQAGVARGFIVRVFADTSASAGGPMPIFSATGGSTFTAEGEMNSIKRVSVSNKSSVNIGLRVYQPGSGGNGKASFYASVVFVR